MSSLQKHPKKDSLIQFRVSATDKSIIQKAAELHGIEASTYMRTLILETAKREVNRFSEENRIVLTPEEWEHFMEVMNAPLNINKNLKRAFSDFKKKYG